MVTGILSWKIVLKFCIHNDQLAAKCRRSRDFKASFHALEFTTQKFKLKL